LRKGLGSAYDKWNISWSFVTQIFHSGQPIHGGDCKTLASVVSLLAATLYQGNPDRNHKCWNIVSTEIYIYIYTPYAGAAGLFLHMNGTFTMGKLKSSLVKYAKKV
jgi:hypothetical protein